MLRSTIAFASVAAAIATATTSATNSSSSSLRGADDSSNQSMATLFEAWSREHGVELSAQEQAERLAIFEANHKRIMEHNKSGSSTFTMAHNKFSHLTAEEFKSQMTGDIKNADVQQQQQVVSRRLLSSSSPPGVKAQDVNASVPESKDWTSEGAVTSVKDQGACSGGGYAFAAVGAYESVRFQKTGELVELSEQEFIDCDNRMLIYPGNNGCAWGDPSTAFLYAEKYGLASETDYSYKGKLFQCRSLDYARTLNPDDILGMAYLPAGDEEKIKEVVAQRPVTAEIAADSTGFQFYSSGVMNAACAADELNHSVLVVGYGADGGADYWKLKNSWGADWGEDGYIRIQRGNNQCGVAETVAYSTLK